MLFILQVSILSEQLLVIFGDKHVSRKFIGKMEKLQAQICRCTRPGLKVMPCVVYLFQPSKCTVCIRSRATCTVNHLPQLNEQLGSPNAFIAVVTVFDVL